MEESLRREVTRLREENALLLEVSNAIVAELDIEKVFDLVAERAREIVGAETMAAPFINKDRASYTYQAAAGKGAADIVGATFGIHVGMCGWVLENEKSLLFGESKEWWMPERTSWEEGQQSALLVPLFGRRKIIGGLSAIGKIGGGSFTEHDLDLLTIFANQVSVAIENARLFREHEEAIQRLEVEISERAAVQAALEEEKERLAVTLRSIGDGVATTDTEGKIVLMNRVAENLTGWSLAEAKGRHLDEVFRLVDEKTGEPFPSPVEEDVPAILDRYVSPSFLIWSCTLSK